MERDAGFVHPEVLLDLPRRTLNDQPGLKRTQDTFDGLGLEGAAPVAFPVDGGD